jgi:hypothetical protein
VPLFFHETFKKNKLASQFVEKTWKLMQTIIQGIPESIPNVKGLWRWER